MWLLSLSAVQRLTLASRKVALPLAKKKRDDWGTNARLCKAEPFSRKQRPHEPVTHERQQSGPSEGSGNKPTMFLWRLRCVPGVGEKEECDGESEQRRVTKPQQDRLRHRSYPTRAERRPAHFRTLIGLDLGSERNDWFDVGGNNKVSQSEPCYGVWLTSGGGRITKEGNTVQPRSIYRNKHQGVVCCSLLP